MNMAVVELKYLASFVTLFLIFHSDKAISIEEISAGTNKQNYNIDVEKVVRMASSTFNNAIKQFSLPLYISYFEVVSENTTEYPLHENYRRVFEKLGIYTDMTRISYSPYLASAVNKVAMTDCNIVYFPNKSLVDKINTGQRITKKQMHLLLHEVGHTQQCQKSSREMYARQWFNDLSPAIVAALNSGQIETKIIHDAMPLEKEAETFAKKMMLEVIKH